MLLGSSVFSFTLILLAFLIGLGVGAAVFARASQRTQHPIRWLAALHLATAGAVGLTYLFTDKIPFVFTWLLQSSSFGVDAILFCQFVLACITVLPATLLMGGVFPLTVRVATGGLDTVGHDVGNAYALNTVGRDRRLFSLRLRRAAAARPREGDLRLGAVRHRAGGGAVLGRAPAVAAAAARPASPPPSRWRCSAS